MYVERSPSISSVTAELIIQSILVAEAEKAGIERAGGKADIYQYVLASEKVRHL